ncbi:uncharacterized protein LOC119548894 [Drosophila subpulchrella]|uniref:uncharacterized protein LOC119548894 n=1 Tax=Drosophila subpulchrella TaxID=1486046 RepID=UPI0018A131AA|nr:uncharacterized protein LOC119548894 [Drosophila subpulchrella]
MWISLLVFVLLGLLNMSSLISSQDDGFHEHLATYLRPGEPHIQDGQTLLNMLYIHNQVQVYCQRPTELTFRNAFQSNRLRLKIAPGVDYSQYKGSTAREVYEAHRQANECYEGKPLGPSAEESRIIPLATHSHACYGIYTNEPFELTLEEIGCDLERLAQFTFALVLWVSSPHLAESLLGFYFSAAAVGAHLAGVMVVGVTLISSGSEQSLGLRTLKGTFKQVLQERPTMMTLALMGGAWLSQSACQRLCFLWERSLLRRLHHHFLRTTAYCLIFTASDHRAFGCVCISLLTPWPELHWLISWLRSKYVRYQENSRDYRELTHPSEHSLQPQDLTRFLGGGIDYSDQEPFLSQGNGSFNTLINRRFHQNEEQEPQDEGNGNAFNCECCSAASNLHNRPSTWNCLNKRLQLNPNRRRKTRTLRSSSSQVSCVTPKSSVTTLYHNLRFSNSERSLRDQ